MAAGAAIGTGHAATFDSSRSREHHAGAESGSVMAWGLDLAEQHFQLFKHH